MKVIGVVSILLACASVGCGGNGSTGNGCLLPDGGTTTTVTATAAPPVPPVYAFDSGVTVHPLFSNGEEDPVDLSNPCNTAPIWKDGINLVIVTGLTVVFNGALWQTTADGLNDNWTQAVCDPPGKDWCVAKYGWKQVGTCP